jgi:hypothetical protein
MVLVVGAVCAVGIVGTGIAAGVAGYALADGGGNKATQKIDMKNFIENEINSSVTNTASCEARASAYVTQIASVECSDISFETTGGGCGGPVSICSEDMKATAVATASCKAEQQATTQISNDLANSITNELTQQSEQITSALPLGVTAGSNEIDSETNVHNETKTKISNKIENILRSVAESQVQIKQDGTIKLGNIKVSCSNTADTNFVNDALVGINDTASKVIKPKKTGKWFDVGVPDVVGEGEVGEFGEIAGSQRKMTMDGGLKFLPGQEPGWKSHDKEGESEAYPQMEQTSDHIARRDAKFQGPGHGIDIGAVDMVSVAQSIAHASAKQIADAVVDNKVTSEMASKVMQSSKQSAGDMTGIIILAAVIGLTIVGYVIYNREENGPGPVEAAAGGKKIDTI